MASKPLTLNLDGISESDLRRFAACFLLMSDRSSIKWDAAAAAYGAKGTVESFRTVTSKAISKHVGGDAAGASKRKRKASSEPNGDAPAAKKKGATKGKAPTTEEENNGESAAVKAESDGYEV